MKIVAVVGAGSGCGKTTVVCRILRSIPGLGAVKISPHEGPSGVEWGPGEPGKDTDLYADSGAACVARIVGPRDQVVPTWNLIKSTFEAFPAVVVEGSRSVDFPGERFVVFVAGENPNEVSEERSRGLRQNSDLIVHRTPHINVGTWIEKERTSHIDGCRAGMESRRIPNISDSDNELVSIIRRYLNFKEMGK